MSAWVKAGGSAGGGQSVSHDAAPAAGGINLWIQPLRHQSVTTVVLPVGRRGLEFEPQSQKLHCTYCGWQGDVPQEECYCGNFGLRNAVPYAGGSGGVIHILPFLRHSFAGTAPHCQPHPGSSGGTAF